MAGILQWIIGYGLVRGLALLGFGLIGYAAVTAGVQGFIGAAQSAYNGLPAATLQLAALAGVPQALGIICGAIVARLALLGAKRLGILR